MLGFGTCIGCANALLNTCQYIEKRNTLFKTRNMLFEEKKKRNFRILCTEYCTEFITTFNFRVWWL